MEYHYTVMYNDETKKWSVEADGSVYYTDGNVYDKNTFPGWFVPEEGSDCEFIDHEVYLTLSYLVDTFPTPKERASELSDPSGKIGA